MKRTAILLGVAAMSISLVTGAVVFTSNQNKVNSYNAETSDYEILINKDTVTLANLPGSLDQLPRSFKLRYTRFMFDKVLQSSNVNGAFELHPNGAIYNMNENQHNNIFGITGFKNLTINCDSKAKLTATFSNVENGVGETCEVIPNTKMDIGMYAKYRYISIKAVDAPVDITSIKLTYTCFNDAIDTDYEIGVDELKARINDIDTYNTHHPYHGNATLKFEREIDRKEKGYERYINEGEYDFDNMKAHFYDYFEQERGKANFGHQYLSYVNGELIIQQQYNLQGEAKNLYQVVKMSKTAAIKYMYSCGLEGDNYYNSLDEFVYGYGTQRFNYSLQFYHNDEALKHGNEDVVIELNDIKFLTNGQPGTIKLSEDIKRNNVNIGRYPDQSKGSVIEFTRQTIKDNMLESSFESSDEYLGDVLYSSSKQSISFKKSANVIIPSLDGYVKDENLLKKPDIDERIPVNYAVEKFDKITSNLVVDETVTVNGASTLVNEADVNMIDPYGNPLVTKAKSNQIQSYDFQNCESYNILDESELGFYDKYYSWMEGEDIILVHEKSPNPNKPDDKDVKEYNIVKGDKEKYIHIAKHFGNGYYPFVRDYYSLNMSDFVHTYENRKNPQALSGAGAPDGTEIKDSQFSYYRNNVDGSFDFRYFYSLSHYQSVFKDGTYSTDTHVYFKNDVASRATTTIKMGNSDGSQYYNITGRVDFTDPIKLTTRPNYSNYTLNPNLG